MKRKLYFYTVFLVATMLCFAGCSKKENSEDSTGTVATEDEMMEEIAAAAGNKEAVNEELLKGQAIAFSKTENFYSVSIELEILSSKPCKIYYTTDGTDPNQEQELYKKAIELKVKDELSSTVIKAKGYFEDGTETETIVHTYFLSTNIEKRFDTLVFSVTTDPYNLYDDVYGIFVEGKLRRDYIKENPRDRIEPNDPANFNMRGRESEREVYLEILEPDGTKIAEQVAGIRTYGGWSRANNQKSIKIFARKEYDEENNKLRYEFFPFKTAAMGNGTILDSFKQLVLRGCGNDNGFAFIRDELFQTLAGQAGYLDYEAVRPAALFVNGDYRGFFWLHEVYGDEYFEDHYGDYVGNFVILEGGETFKDEDDDGENAETIVDYDAMYTYSTMDLTDNLIYEKLCELIDVENYLSYYALQTYIANEDWPHNNYKTYRYYAAEGEEYREAPFDGKWRYLLHDLDFSFGIYGTAPQTNNYTNYVGKAGEMKEAAPLFSQLMSRDDCKEIFLKKTLDLINGSFSPKNLNKVLDDMNASRLNEQSYLYNKGLLADWVQFDQLEERIEDVKKYGNQRAGLIITKYQEYFGLGEIYKLTVQPAEGGKIKINSFLTDDYFEGSYYKDYDTVITAVVPEGKKFDCWMVNGEKVEGEELVITPTKIVDGKTEVTCVLK
ncbi:MAG: CotH kinase family protein [Mobilitalea sp.]